MSERGPLQIVTLCTGNAARSVMAGIMLAQLAEFEGISVNITTAGTHVVEGQPMGQRTKAALESVGELDTSTVGLHRSHQLSVQDCERADVIIAMEADHIRFIRRVHANSAQKTITLARLVREISVEDAPFVDRLQALDLQNVSLEEEQDVVDPAGGEQPQYDACAQEIWELCQITTALLVTE